MSTRPMISVFLLAGLLTAGAAFASPAANEVPNGHETIAPAFAHVIPNVPGKTISAVLVTYKPGVQSISHRHGTAFVVAYVLSGEIRSQVEGGESKVYHAGESWIEAPGAHHVVSENASKTKSASLLAMFIADSKDKKLVIFDKP